MHRSKAKRTAQIICGVEPELRAAVEAEAERRDTSISSTVRALIRAQLAALNSGQMQAAS